MAQQGSERIGLVLRKKIDSQLELFGRRKLAVRGKPGSGLPPAEFRRNRRLRLLVLVNAGVRVRKLGEVTENEDLKRIGTSVEGRNWGDFVRTV